MTTNVVVELRRLEIDVEAELEESSLVVEFDRTRDEDKLAVGSDIGVGFALHQNS